ncbi:MFS general substrate transporter [Cystobasidium minutum MCA 4210]|uniref:MFS general substrate transporter n=1 Tax=Cystobasidium minutum MCA 4210 TaxID=1397322 RepID=UPI0034CF6D92|eukprot:jgi/Rhomi1/6126/CE6125_2587
MSVDQIFVFVILGGLWVGTFLAALDGTIVATVLAVIGSEFDKSQEISWLGTSYLLTQTAFQPLYGRFSDIFGRKAATLFASAVFLIGSLGCGLSQTFWQLIAARAFAGIGGGGLTTMSSIVTSDLVPLRSRGTYQGLGNLVYAAGAAIGGPLGGWLGDSIGWRWAFLIQVPICIIHFAVVSWKVNIPSGPGSMSEKIKRIDFLGALSMVSAVSLLLVGLSMGGNQLPWNHPLVYGTLIGGGVLVVIFVLVEKYVAREPLLPLRVLISPTPLFVALTCWFITMSQFGILYNVPLYFSAVEQTTSSYAGLHLIPNAIFASTASLLSGIYMARTGVYKNLLIFSGVCGMLGPILMYTSWDYKWTPEWIYWISMIPGGIGYGAILTSTLIALLSSIDPADTAAAIGVTYLFRATGSVLGIAVSTSILQQSLKNNLTKYFSGKHADKIIDKIRQNVDYIRELQGNERAAAIASYWSAMHNVFLAVMIAAILAFVSLLFIQQHHLASSMDKKK